MPQCELSGRSAVVENLVSHSNIKTKTRAFANVQRRTLYSGVLKRAFRAKVSTRALRDIDKLGGVDVYILKQKNSKLSPKVLKLKQALIYKINKEKKTKPKQQEKSHEVKN